MKLAVLLLFLGLVLENYGLSIEDRLRNIVEGPRDDEAKMANDLEQILGELSQRELKAESQLQAAEPQIREHVSPEVARISPPKIGTSALTIEDRMINIVEGSRDDEAKMASDLEQLLKGLSHRDLEAESQLQAAEPQIREQISPEVARISPLKIETSALSNLEDNVASSPRRLASSSKDEIVQSRGKFSGFSPLESRNPLKVGAPELRNQATSLASADESAAPFLDVGLKSLGSVEGEPSLLNGKTSRSHDQARKEASPLNSETLETRDLCIEPCKIICWWRYKMPGCCGGEKCYCYGVDDVSLCD